MSQLIQITTDGQGSSVVSARELHVFLEVRSKFADWFKNRVNKYDFREGNDYVTLSKFLESGGREFDYALTLDTAKELSMVENNQKGREARRYFIDCEKRIRINPAGLSTATEQQLRQQVIDQQALLQQLRTEIDHLTIRQPEPTRLLTMRGAISRHMDLYCRHFNITNNQAYISLYKRLRQVYGVNIGQLRRIGRDNELDALERYGYLEQVFLLVRAEFAIDYVAPRVVMQEMMQITMSMHQTGWW